MATAKKAATPNGKSSGPARRTSSGIGPLAPLEPTLYPEREVPAVPTFAIRETTIARNHSQLKQRSRLSYYVTSTRHTKDIRRYSDRFLKDTGEADYLINFLEYPISKGMFPSELIKKTVLRKRKKSMKEVNLNELGEMKEGSGDEDSAEEGEEGEGGAKKKKKETTTGEGGNSESESESGSEDSDGGVDYGMQNEVDDDDEGFDDDGDGDEGQFD